MEAASTFPTSFRVSGGPDIDEVASNRERSPPPRPPPLAKPRRMISWSPPPPPFVKLNTDGCSKGNPGPAGIGGAIRDHRGNWMIGFASNIGRCSSSVSEWSALKVGLSLAWKMGYKKVLCEVDAAYVLSGLACDGDGGGDDDTAAAAKVGADPCSALRKQCREMMRREGWECHIVHTLREGNACADALSNLGVAPGVAPGSLHIFGVPPPFSPLSDALVRDGLGIAVPRGFRGCVLPHIPRPPPPRHPPIMFCRPIGFVC